MMRKKMVLKKILILLVVLFSIGIANASDITLTTSGKNVEKGNTFTVTFSASSSAVIGSFVVNV